MDSELSTVGNVPNAFSAVFLCLLRGRFGRAEVRGEPSQRNLGCHKDAFAGEHYARNNPPGRSGAVARRRVAQLGSQQELGLRSEWSLGRRARRPSGSS